MRGKVTEYYENHLSPRKFISDIKSRQENKITVLMITDKNTRNNASRLNEKSILIAGKPTLPNSKWYKFFSFFGRNHKQPLIDWVTPMINQSLPGIHRRMSARAN